MKTPSYFKPLKHLGNYFAFKYDFIMSTKL
jgi:hypothetical protein